MSTSTGTASEGFSQFSGPRLFDVPMKSYSALKNPFKDFKVYMLGKSFEYRAGLYDKFYQYPEYFTILSECPKALVREIDVVLIPCTNSWGFAHESLVSLLKHLAPFYKKPVEQLVKQWIYENYLGEQPYGTSFLFEGKGKFVCWSCLSRTPDSLSLDYVYTFIWSAFSEINSYNHYKRFEDSPERIRKVLIPDLTGICNIYPTITPIVNQLSLAVLSWTTSEQSEVTNENIGVIRHNTIIQENTVDRKEMEQNLQGLIWSTEIAKRGLCSIEELNILLEWVNSPTRQISVTSSTAICALLKRPDSEFTLSQQIISERVMSSPAVLATLLRLAAEGTIKTHTEVKREEIEIRSVVGEGTAGVVSGGKWNGITVAIKAFNNSANPKEFYREVSLLTLIKHKHIVSLHGASMDTKDPFLVEDLMEASLYDIIHCKTLDLPESLKLHFAYGTAKGMKVLHSIGIIHRDLKSLNVLVSKDMVAKICDFGLSRVVDKSKANMTQNIGTVSWTAPEVFSKKGYTEKADVYSFGIVLWELLTREKPFGEVAAFSVPLLVTKGERPAIPKDCPKDYRNFIQKCWHKKSIQRPDFVRILETLTTFKLNSTKTLRKNRLTLTRTKKGFTITSRAPESSSSEMTQCSSETNSSAQEDPIISLSSTTTPEKKMKTLRISKNSNRNSLGHSIKPFTKYVPTPETFLTIRDKGELP